MDTRYLIESFDPWRETPRKFIVVLLLSVFFLFTTIAFAYDIISMGREQSVHFVLGVVLSGAFAVFYVVMCVSFRKKWWMVAIPIFVVQLVVMSWLASRFPDQPVPASMSAAELGHARIRLTLDSIAIMVAVSLGYTGFVSVSVKEARRYVKTRTEKALLESEMAAARQVQQVILPNPHLTIPGFVIESAYRPAREVGGDFFQILPVADGGLLIAIGDVCGKGLPAAMLVSLLIGSIRTTAEETHDPAVLLGKLHARVAERTQVAGHTAEHTMDGFVTALAAFIANDGLVMLANAGHLSPYLDGQEIELAGALPLGIGDGQYEVITVDLPRGGRLAFLSDGVVEAQKPTGELLGFDRAKAMSNESAAAIVEAAVQFGQADDITVVTIERREAEDLVAEVIDAGQKLQV
jgi:Stage II sporulation protein E (SpoIIE)